MAIRKDILDAAASVFYDKGYERATLEDVAALVGIQKASLYHHIRSKEQLLFEIHELLHEELWRETESVVAANGSPGQKLQGVICVILRLIQNNREHAGVFTREHGSLSEANQAIVSERRAAYVSLVTQIIVRGIEAQEFRVAEPRIVALGIIGMANRAVDWFDPKGPYSADEIAVQFADLALHGLSKPV